MPLPVGTKISFKLEPKVSALALSLYHVEFCGNTFPVSAVTRRFSPSREVWVEPMWVDAQGSGAHGGVRAECRTCRCPGRCHRTSETFSLSAQMPPAWGDSDAGNRCLNLHFFRWCCAPQARLSPGTPQGWVMLREDKQDFGLSERATVALMLHPKEVQMRINPKP